MPSRTQRPRYARRRRASLRLGLTAFGLNMAVMEARWSGIETRNAVTVYDDTGNDLTSLLVKEVHGPVNFEAGGSFPAELSATGTYWLADQGSDVYTVHNSHEDARNGINDIVMASYDPVANTLTVGRDFSIQGLIEYMKKGVKLESIKRASTASPDAVFAD